MSLLRSKVNNQGAPGLLYKVLNQISCLIYIRLFPPSVDHYRLFTLLTEGGSQSRHLGNIPAAVSPGEFLLHPRTFA